MRNAKMRNLRNAKYVANKINLNKLTLLWKQQ